MLLESQIIKRASEILTIESEAIQGVQASLDQSFISVCKELFSCKGKIILLGLGKSGIIAKKIAATLSSTGAPSFFIHASEAIHGDIGMISKQDIIVAVSHSGETQEIITTLSVANTLGIVSIAMTSNSNSRLAQIATMCIHIPINREACQHNLAPTASTTAMLALGDAIALILFEMKGMTSEDFARTHPAGTLGKKLLTTVESLAHFGKDVPSVSPSVFIIDAALEMSNKRLGCTLITHNQEVEGIFTDGDLRRLIHNTTNLQTTQISNVMSKKFKSINASELASNALQIMRISKIQVLVVNSERHGIGVLSIYDIIDAGLSDE
ncbi:MAG: KpsF/GutQ family sugar-phosphate isomerase [Methylacidiphilales bacterium]|nr:KpsF/GutQ family sugar-phosphate isomerase [Candidatus Methylacidiphilales bacterium]